MDDYNLELEETLEGHRDRVWCARWHPNGRLLATCGADKTIRIWAKEGIKWRCLSLLTDTHQRTIRFVAWSHDGRFLSSTSFDGTTCIWQRKNDSSELEEEIVEEPVVNSEDFSKSDSWSVLFSLEGHENEVKSSSWSVNDDFLATCSRDKSVWIWEKIELNSNSGGAIPSGDDNEDEEEEPFFECASVQTEHTQDVKRVIWHPTLNILASASFDNDILLYCQGDEDWYCFATLSEHDSTVWAIDFNRDGTRLVSVSADETVKIWQPQNYQELLTTTLVVKTQNDPTSQTKNALVQSRKYAQLCSKWTIVSSLSGYHRWQIYDVSWSPLNDCILTGGADNSLHVFKDLKSCKENIDPEDSYMASRYRQICYRTEAHEQDINSVHWNPKVSDQLVSASDDGMVRIWKLTTAKIE